MAQSPHPKARSTALMGLAIGMNLLGIGVLVGIFGDAPTTQMRLGFAIILLTSAASMGMAFHARSIASRSWPEAREDETSG